MEDTQKWGNELTRPTCEMLKSQTVRRVSVKFNRERKPFRKAGLKEKKAGDGHLVARSHQPINNKHMYCLSTCAGLGGAEVFCSLCLLEQLEH